MKMIHSGHSCLSAGLKITTILLIIGVVYAGSMTGPSNVVGTTKGTVQLTCGGSSCETFLWQFLSATTSLDTVCNGQTCLPKYKTRYSVTKSGQSVCNLIIKDVQLTDAGTFYCSDLTTGPSMGAHLIIVESAPVCHSNMTGPEIDELDVIGFSCSASYASPVTPTVTWYDAEGTEVTSKISYTSNSLTSTVAIIAQATLVDSYRFILKFPVPTAADDRVATNEPLSGTMDWMSEVFKVRYAVRKVRISPPGTQFDPGQTVTCSADGYPPPEYKWIEVETQREINGDVLMPSSSNHSYKCVATNQFKGQGQIAESQAVIFTGAPPDASKSSVGMAVGIAFGVIIALVVVIVISCYVIRTRKHKQNLAKTNKHGSAEEGMPMNQTTVPEVEVRKPSSVPPVAKPRTAPPGPPPAPDVTQHNDSDKPPDKPKRKAEHHH